MRESLQTDRIFPMILPSFPSLLRQRAVRWLGWAVLVPHQAWAANDPVDSKGNVGWFVAGSLVVLGLAVWVGGWWRRRSNAAGLESVAALIARTDCLLWEAQVELNGDDWKWRFTFHDSALARRLFEGSPPGQPLALWNRFEIPEQAEMNRRAREALVTGKPGYEQYFRLLREGQLIWLHESVSISSLGAGRFRLVGLATDITIQREAELSNRAIQQQLQQLLTHANCMIWQAEVRRDAASGSFVWDWFVPRSELYRRLLGDHPDEKAIMPWGLKNVPEFADMEARSQQAMLGGHPGYEQVFRIIEDGKTCWMHEQATITHLASDRWKIAGVVIDITAKREAEEAQRQSEKRLEHLLERADCTIWQARVTLMDDDHFHWEMYLPPSKLLRRINDNSSGPVTGFGWRELGVPEVDEMIARYRRALLDGAAGYEQEFHLPRPERTLWFSEQVAITLAGPGEWDLLGITTDVTARRELEEARRATEARLEQVLEMADCMVWHAAVKLNPDKTYDWRLTTQRSVLYRRLFGEESTGTALDWRKLNVPEIGEMDERFMNAFRNRLPSYENLFRVITPTRVTWLRETITLQHLGPEEVRLVGVITDVTSQREAEEARRDSEHQVRQMLETADCLLWQAKVASNAAGELHWSLIVPSSRLYREIFGTDPDDSPMLPWPEVIEAETYAEINARSSKAIRAGLPGYEQEFLAQRGERVFWLHERVAISPILTGGWRLVGVVTDLSARRAAEQSVRASEVRYRSLFQHTPVAIVETDFREVGRWLDDLRLSGVADLAAWLDADERRLHDCARRVRIFAANDSAMRMFRARRLGDFRRRRGLLATPDSLQAIRLTMLALWQGKNTLETQLEMRDFDGITHFMNVRWWVGQNEQGLDLSQSLLVFVDLTDLKRAEALLATEKERLAVTLRAMAEGVVTTDVAGLIQFMNPAAAALTEWDASAIGQPVSRICVFENERAGAGFEFPAGRVIQTDTVVDLPPQTRLLTRQGLRRLVDGCCAPIHAADSKVIGMVFVFRDVTEHERLEQEVIRASRLESVGLLAGGIAHDFNNILTGVMGNLTLARLDVEDKSDAGARLREAEKATLRARDLTQQLLTFAKGGDPVRSAVQLAAIVQDTATFALHGSNVKPIFYLSSDLWPADADKGQIGRVVQNLVINAIQAMPAGGTIRLSGANEIIAGLNRPGLVPGRYVQIAIADTGEGIRPENLAKIFDPYFTTKKSGTGLGLAAVYSIIKKHRGHIEVESTVGRGTVFRLWLPAADNVPVQAAAPVVPMTGKFAGRVLFMDDEEIIRRMAVMMLERLGFTVECAEDGNEAVARFRAAHVGGKSFSLVIMDLTVPGGMGGREAIDRLKDIDPAVKAIVSSGYSSDPVLANYRAHGFCGVVAKPYRMEDFIQVLREALPEATT